MTILDDILTQKRIEVASLRKSRPLDQLLNEIEQRPSPLHFPALTQGSPTSSDRVALIAEIKRHSPSRGVLNADLDPLSLAEIYIENGASAISILTDEKYFHGHLEDLEKVANHHHQLALLRKDFIIDPHQLYESRAAGADAILLIVAALSPRTLGDLLNLVNKLGMTALVEVHDAHEIEIAVDSGAKVIGINNRDLRDFSVHMETTLTLRPLIPAGIKVVSESGIRTREDVRKLAQMDVDAVLVGEALVMANDVPAQVRSFSSVSSFTKISHQGPEVS